MGLIALECTKNYERQGLTGYKVSGIMIQGDDSMDGKGLVMSMKDRKGEITAMYDPSRMTMEEAVLKALEIEDK